MNDKYMFVTQRLYEDDPTLLTCSAKVLDALDQNNTAVVILDKTVFHPQSAAAQENEEGISDIGLIESERKRFHVIRVERVEDTVRHIGICEGNLFEVDEEVTCSVSEDFAKELRENK